MHPANFGRLCSKGSALGETLGLDGRLLHPMLRRRRRARARRLGRRARPRRATASGASSRAHGPDAVAFYLSGQLLTEDYYVANKLMKGFLGSANVDTNSRLCMASSVAGHRRAFGADTVPGVYEDLDEADLIVLVGSNAAWCHPVLFQRMRGATSASAAPRIVVIDPRRTATARGAPTCFCRSRPAPTPRCSAACSSIWPSVGALDHDYIERAHARLRRGAGARPRDRARRRGDRRGDRPRRAPTSSASSTGSRATPTRRHLLLAGRQPVGAGHRQGQRHHQLPSRDRPHRQARHGPVLAHRPAQRHGRPRGRRARQPARRAHGLLAGRDRPRAPLLARAAHGDARRPQGRADVRGDRARRDQGAVGDGDQPGGVAAARRRRARGARASSTCSSSPRTCARTTPSNAGAHVLLPAAAWGEKDGTVTNSERRISRQRAFLPLPGEAQARLVDRRRGGAAHGLRRRLRLSLAPPTCFASTPRCRLRERRHARFRSRRPRRHLPTPSSTRSRRSNGRCAPRRGGGRAPLLRRRRLLHARPQGALRRARAAGAARRDLATHFRSGSTPAASATSGTP